MIKYADIKYYIDKYKNECYNKGPITSIHLSSDIYLNLCSELNITDSSYFIYDEYKFKLMWQMYENYIIFFSSYPMGIGYDVLSEEERIIKDIIE